MAIPFSLVERGEKMGIGNYIHAGCITNWHRTDGFDVDKIYSTVEEANPVFDFAEILRQKNSQDGNVQKISCNSLFLDCSEDCGIIPLMFLNGQLVPKDGFIIPHPAGKDTVDFGFEINGFQLIVESGAEIRFVANYF